ncbi:DUF805 domain-containing protein [Neokomagataea anthophila]|uniref:DUF805 domain-containing protein n=1 Tax=Neokomagataea anthophila TaxID=2826925 RepID=A0ABS5E7U2_9PROT|nr:DUF805 domain-containing protein [Neokomagataea anthophila]MBR0559941.1 DUF805 domain-containing protein [Neokomagataea anthophila]
MKWFFVPYKRYFDFSGRSSRSEYWLYILSTIIAIFVVSMIILAISIAMGMKDNGGAATLFYIVLGFWGLISIIPHWALVVRRFHDQDLSGFLALLNFIPFFGGLIVLVFMCLPGTQGANKFGWPYKS